MVFSTNQTRQLYVVTTDGGLKTSSIIATDKAGSILPKSDNKKSHFYLEYKGVAGLMRSDLMDINNILYVKATDADAMARDLKAYTVTLDTEVNGGNPVAGQDYMLRIAFRQYVGMSDEDQYFKYGVAHAYAGMTTSQLYEVLSDSLAKNFIRELYPLINVSLIKDNNEKVPVLKNGEILKYEAGTFKGIFIDEVEQEWTLGVKACVPVYFTVYPQTIMLDGDERIWGKVEKADSLAKVENGKIIADLEYFCMGERGDQYRNIGWPHVIPTKYLVNPANKYNVIDIHYAWQGAGENIQKSEKTISIAVPKIGATNSVSNTLTNNVIKAINTATGLNIDLLDTSAS